jgi:hypothetical protein
VSVEDLYADLDEKVKAEAQKIIAKYPVTSRFPGHTVRSPRPRKLRLHVMTSTQRRRQALQNLTNGQINSIVKAMRNADNKVLEAKNQAQKYGVRMPLIWKIYQERQGAHKLRKAMKILDA